MALYAKLNDEGLHNIHNNPLFVDNAKGMDNPLHNM